VSALRSAGHTLAHALAERASELEARLHAAAAEASSARRALAARDDDVASLAAQLRAAKARPHATWLHPRASRRVEIPVETRIFAFRLGF
jgi:hypothetical protein